MITIFPNEHFAIKNSIVHITVAAGIARRNFPAIRKIYILGDHSAGFFDFFRQVKKNI